MKEANICRIENVYKERTENDRDYSEQNLFVSMTITFDAEAYDGLRPLCFRCRYLMEKFTKCITCRCNKKYGF